MELYGQSPCLHAEVLTFAETFRAGVPASRRDLLRRRMKNQLLFRFDQFSSLIFNKIDKSFNGRIRLCLL